MNETEFSDKSGKQLCMGDIVQWRLGKFAKKSNGPAIYRIDRTRKGVFLVNVHDEEIRWRLRKTHESFIVLIERSTK
ncbi:MAG TPA: hypothetical protein VNI82_00555 [Candidatus Nitrosotenuis sp.]|nr:hypothetical protein [Candidatus Nitrosotenuis sp.]